MHAPTTALRRPMLSAFALALAFALCATEASAAGAVVDAQWLAPADAKSLSAAIAQARAASPGTFEARDRLRAELPAFDAAKRGPYAPMSRPLKGLGPEAVPALLEALAVDAGLGPKAAVPSQPPQGLSESAWLAWRVGLLEAVGAHRDPSAAPVLRATLERADTEPAALELPVLRAAAAAYGKLGEPEAVRTLVRHAQGGGPRAQAALYGLGHARTVDSARALAAELAKLPDASRAGVVIHALGDVGSDWAWKAIARRPRGADPKQAEATRLVAVEALVRAYLPYGGEVRRGIENALAVIDDPRARALLEREKLRADAATVAAIDALVARLAKGPRGR